MSMLIIVMMIIVIMMIVIMMIIIHKISQATTRRVWVQVFETIGPGSFNLKKDNFFMILIMILLTLPDGWRRSSPGHCIEKVTSFHSVGRFNFWEPTLLFSPSSNPGHCVKMSPQFISSLESDFKYWKQTRKRQMHQASTNKVFKEIRTKLNEPDIEICLS